MEHYEANLRHMAEPSTPAERREATSVSLDAEQASYLHEILLSYASYGAESDENESIAKGYAQYLVDRAGVTVGCTVYAHTSIAADTLLDAMYYYADEMGFENIYTDLYRETEDDVARLVQVHLDPDDVEMPSADES